jgi:hypothetical protein
MGQFVPPNCARVTWSKDQLTGVLSNEGGTNAPVVSWTEIKRRVTEAGPALRELQRIVESPAPNFGFRNRSFETPSIWKEKCQASSWLACAALLNLRDGHHQEALANIQALAGLADLHREECLFVEQIGRVAIGGACIALTWEALQLGGWNDQQLASLQRIWERFDFLTALEKGLEGERAFPLELLARLRSPQFRAQSRAKASPTPWNYGSRFPAGVLENDALYGLCHLQGTLILARQLQGGRPLNEVMESLREHQAGIDAKSRSVTRIFYVISVLGILDVSKAVELAGQVEALRRLAVVAIALHRHELKHGRFPASINNLAPEFLAAIPRDCMDGKNLKYRVSHDGMFSLYSAGSDGRDDGGDPTPLQSDSGFGRGRDTVWPTALKPTKSRQREEAALSK